MRDDFAARAYEYEKKSAWVADDIVCGHAINLLATKSTHLGNILDAGGGTGILASSIASVLPSHSVTVMDISAAMLAKVPKEFKKVHCSIESVRTLDKQFDTILLRQVLHYLADPSNAINELFSVLSPNGVLYVGQIVVPDNESALWLQHVAEQISPNRRRVWQLTKLISLFLSTGMKLDGASIHPFRDTLNTWMQRSTVRLDWQHVFQKAATSITHTVKKTLGIEERAGDILFEVLFCHAIFSRRQ